MRFVLRPRSMPTCLFLYPFLVSLGDNWSLSKSYLSIRMDQEGTNCTSNIVALFVCVNVASMGTFDDIINVCQQCSILCVSVIGSFLSLVLVTTSMCAINQTVFVYICTYVHISYIFFVFNMSFHGHNVQTYYLISSCSLASFNGTSLLYNSNTN